MKKQLSFISGLALAISTGATLMAPAASAGESTVQEAECNTWVSNSAPWRGYAKCTAMLPVVERFQVKLICVTPHGTTFTVYGPGKGNGQTSSAKCSDNPNVGISKVGVYVYRI
ncbi:hypothetical protein ACIOJD_04625 [Streptomyces sp. NPDC088116]|uniref:hypothetical protein n=1 Tax=Streptomyces sp. NPDC088116 TaxID=3365825 RepID=UPI00382E1D4A